MDWALPLNASAQGEWIDGLFWLIFAITMLALVIVEIGIAWFLIRYRRREGRRARYTHGSTVAEVVWTAVPAVVLIFLGIYSGRIWGDMRSPESFPSDALTLEVHAQQFEWYVTYPGADGVPETEDDFRLRNRFEVPVGEPVVVRLHSDDVIHSFFIPELRVKQDAVPGMVVPVWFTPTRTGEFQLACAELCGLGHYRMRGSVVVHEAAAYRRWVEEQSAEALAARADGGGARAAR